MNRSLGFVVMAAAATGCSVAPTAQNEPPLFAKGNGDTDSRAILSWASTVTVAGVPVPAGIQGDGCGDYQGNICGVEAIPTARGLHTIARSLWLLGAGGSQVQYEGFGVQPGCNDLMFEAQYPPSNRDGQDCRPVALAALRVAGDRSAVSLPELSIVRGIHESV